MQPTRGFFDSLAFRVLTLLTLALMPIGAIAIYQNSVLWGQFNERAAAALVTRSELSVALERRVLQRAFGAAEAVELLTAPVLENPAACHAELKHLTEQGLFTFVGILPRSLLIECSSEDGPLDRSDNPTIARRFDEGQPFVSALQQSRIGEPVAILGLPIFADEDPVPVRFVVASIPLSTLLIPGPWETESLRSKALYDGSGRLLSTSTQDGSEADAIPENTDIAELIASGELVFSARSEAGNERTFSIVPVYEDVAYVLESWEPQALASRSLIPWLFPILMWIATLSVTYVAINRLVVRHVRVLGQRVEQFAQNRRVPQIESDIDQPVEFYQMNRTFRDMTNSILNDERELEDALNEKSLLLREVHHRVKNNLQLIASIMNMQIRQSTSEETRESIKRLQERVLGLATVHRSMYDAESLVDIPAHDLVRDVVEQTISLSPHGKAEWDTTYDSLLLGPDQAIPLAMIAAEATANSIKHASDVGTSRVSVKLVSDGNQAAFSIQNPAGDHDATKEGGLGIQLIHGLVEQLSGELDISTEPGWHHLAVTFRREVQRPFLDS